MTKDWTDYLSTQTDEYVDMEHYCGSEWSDEYYGLPEYRDYVENWC